MAETYSVPGTPRVYIDNILFGRSIGIPIETNTGNQLLWDMDPVRTTNYQGAGVNEIHIELFIRQENLEDTYAFQGLLSSSNYVAVFNHNFYSGGDPVSIRVSQSTVDGTNTTITPGSLVGDFTFIESDGYMIGTLPYQPSSGTKEFDIRVNSSEGSEVNFSDDHNYNIGCCSFGTYLDFPVSPDLSVKMGYSHEGVQSKRTIAGKDLTHVSYSGAPNWGELTPFTITDQYNENVYFSGAGLTGRKTWDMKFSYVDKTDMFNAVQSGSSAGIYNNGELEHDTSIIGTYLSRTLGGKLRHVLQPDNSKNEFYMVKLDQKSTSITQVAHGVFEISFKFVQVW